MNSTETAKTAPAGAGRKGAQESARESTQCGAEETAVRGRAHIDELDARIIALVQERRGVSADIERARGGAGGGHAGGSSRSAAHGGLAREMEILDRYRGELGRHGTQLAMTLLTLCRGRR